MPNRTLIFIPTYNERENAPRMCEAIHQLGIDADLLFVDDNSPDGTGECLEAIKSQFPRLIVHHRAGKLGVGSAHLDAIRWAYEQEYQTMITMDCDFTHSPSDIPAMLQAAEDCDVVVGSRWTNANSLPGWNLFRRIMTWLGHFLTKSVLGVPQDASGAFRAFRLDRIPREVFGLIKSRGYSFFFETLFVLSRNEFRIVEVPIILPARTYGHSKMTVAAAEKSALYIFQLALENLQSPEQYLLEKRSFTIDPALVDPQDWDAYWNNQSSKSGIVYQLIAGSYRRAVIKRNLNCAVKGAFPPGSALLHAGCGSGQVDTELQEAMRLTALDISPGALHLYARNNRRAERVTHGSIFQLPFPEATFDGVYNLGVLEHFTHDEIERILAEFHRVLRPGGKVLVFWPHRHATSVLVLRFAHFLLNRIMKRNRTFHPPEISLLRNRAEAESILERAKFKLIDYQFGIQDFFVQAIVVGER